MKYSKATNYALHTMVHLTMEPKGQAVSVDQLAYMQNLSPTYLSKILTKLVKAGLIESVPGAKGGYSISRRAQDISFLDVIEAVEGQSVLFNCGFDHEESECLIERVMVEAEGNMKKELAGRTIQSIAEQIEKKHGHETKKEK